VSKDKCKNCGDKGDHDKCKECFLKVCYDFLIRKKKREEVKNK